MPKPAGKTMVTRALIDATTELFVEKGRSISVREIASRAGVNHGLVHTYFGSKDALLAAAFDDVYTQAVAELDPAGFPPPDIAGQRGGLLAKALARVILDAPGDDLFAASGITSAWRAALADACPELPASEVDARVVAAASLSLGYALFSDRFSASMGHDALAQAAVAADVADLVSKIGSIPVD